MPFAHSSMRLHQWPKRRSARGRACGPRSPHPRAARTGGRTRGPGCQNSTRSRETLELTGVREASNAAKLAASESQRQADEAAVRLAEFGERCQAAVMAVDHLRERAVAFARAEQEVADARDKLGPAQLSLADATSQLEQAQRGEKRAAAELLEVQRHDHAAAAAAGAGGRRSVPGVHSRASRRFHSAGLRGGGVCCDGAARCGARSDHPRGVCGIRCVARVADCRNGHRDRGARSRKRRIDSRRTAQLSASTLMRSPICSSQRRSF